MPQEKWPPHDRFAQHGTLCAVNIARAICSLECCYRSLRRHSDASEEHFCRKDLPAARFTIRSGGLDCAHPSRANPYLFDVQKKSDPGHSIAARVQYLSFCMHLENIFIRIKAEPLTSSARCTFCESFFLCFLCAHTSLGSASAFLALGITVTGCIRMPSSAQPSASDDCNNEKGANGNGTATVDAEAAESEKQRD